MKKSSDAVTLSSTIVVVVVAVEISIVRSTFCCSLMLLSSNKFFVHSVSKLYFNQGVRDFKGLVIPDQFFLKLSLNDIRLQVIILSKKKCIKNFHISLDIDILISSFSKEKRR